MKKSLVIATPFFSQVHMFSYQCSQLSTPGSVIEVFNMAKRFQRGQDTTKYVSVVVLDEVGLAEDSPNLPLKALHPLLEDGTEGADDSDQVHRDIGGPLACNIHTYIHTQNLRVSGFTDGVKLMPSTAR